MKKTLLIILGLAVVAAAVWYFGFRQDDGGMMYQGNSPEECQRIQILCIQGYERFDDANGCGCRPILEGSR